MSDLGKYDDLINHQDNGGDDALSDFLKKSAQVSVPASTRKEAIWDKISESVVEERTEEAKVRSIPMWRYVGVAAAVVLLALFFIPKLNSDPTVVAPMALIFLETGTGESKNVVLPDGSAVTLNASSSIAHSETWKRELTLKGEAFFEVTKGSTFTVKTAFGNVEVLGTSFNVFARDGSLDVACKTGKVNVSVPERSISENLTPGRAITVDMDTVRVSLRVTESIGTWQSGEFFFENKPISSVFEEFERQFNIQIEQDLETQSPLLFTGYFRNDKDLEGALESVCAVMGLQYTKTGQNKFTITESSK